MSEAADLGTIVVVGVRKKPSEPPMEEMDTVSEDPANSGGGVVSQQDADQENKRQEDCAAKAVGEKIKAKLDSHEKEYFSHVFTNGDTTAYHPPRGGTGVGLSRQQFDSARTEFGISPWNVRGIVHNHPASYYCDGVEYNNAPFSQAWADRQIAFNQYPSEADWQNAQELVSSGNYSSDLTLYIVGCDGVTRGFHYSEMQNLRPLVTDNNMLNGTPPALRAASAPDCSGL